MANVTRYDPFDLLEGMMKSVLRPHYEDAVSQQRNGRAWSIPIDVIEDEKSYTIWAELPGVRKEELNVSIIGNQLALSAELKQENQVDQGQGNQRTLVKERRVGTF